jgi:hypothetical protein
MHPKVFVKLIKNPKNPLVRAKKPNKKSKKTKKPQKNPKKTKKKPLGWVFFLKKPGFFQPCDTRSSPSNQQCCGSGSALKNYPQKYKKGKTNLMF